MKPPQCQFNPVLPHPNVYPYGTICLSILNEEEDWKSSITVNQILFWIQKLLKDEPYIESPVQYEPCNQCNRAEYPNKAKEFALYNNEWLLIYFCFWKNRNNINLYYMEIGMLSGPIYYIDHDIYTLTVCSVNESHLELCLAFHVVCWELIKSQNNQVQKRNEQTDVINVIKIFINLICNLFLLQVFLQFTELIQFLQINDFVLVYIIQSYLHK